MVCFLSMVAARCLLPATKVALLCFCCLHQVEGRIINCGIINCSTEQRNFVKAGCSCA